MTLLTAVKNRPCEWLSLSSSTADRAGASVTALNTDKTTAKAMVSENCW
jgi:hypothetical protein